MSKILLLPDGDTMVSLSTDVNINFRNLISQESTKKLTQVKPAKYYIDMAISPDGKTLAIVPLGGPIIIWNLEEDTYITTLTKYIHDVFSLEFSPDGQTLAIGLGNQFVVFWDLSSKTITTNLWGDVPSEGIVDISFSPDGKTLATVSRNQAVGSDTESIVFWDILSKKVITVLNDYTDDSNCLTFSPDGDSLASVSSNGTVNVWQLNE